jgi:hypothetical protein
MAEPTTVREKFGIGEALLNDPIYGPDLQEVFDLWKAGKTTEAADAYVKSAWGQLDTDAQDALLMRAEKNDVYKEKLKEFGIKLRKQIAPYGVAISDKDIEDYYVRGIDEDVILDDLIGGIEAGAAAGTAADDLADLRTVARNNGFDLDVDFGNQVDGWLQRIARGESPDDFKRLIRNQAKLGLPEKIQNLMDEGLDLANIYAPYRNTMAALLEVTPDSISLTDPILQSAYGPDKETSIFDFKRAVRKDPRWQYTDNAREEVSTAALGILRDFGFQG